MKTILQSTELAFSHISIQDAIILLPIVDELATKFRNLTLLVENIRKNPHNFTEEEIQEAEKEYFTAGDQLVVLTRLGFTASRPDMIQFNSEDFPTAYM